MKIIAYASPMWSYMRKRGCILWKYGNYAKFYAYHKKRGKGTYKCVFFSVLNPTHTHKKKMKMETLFIIILNIAIIFLYNFYYIVVPFCVWVVWGWLSHNISWKNFTAVLPRCSHTTDSHKRCLQWFLVLVPILHDEDEKEIVKWKNVQWIILFSVWIIWIF